MQALINILKWNQIKIRFDTWTNGSTNKRVFGAMVIVIACTLLVKVAALLKDMVVAKTFGTGDAMDALLGAFVASRTVCCCVRAEWVVKPQLRAERNKNIKITVSVEIE